MCTTTSSNLFCFVYGFIPVIVFPSCALSYTRHTCISYMHFKMDISSHALRFHLASIFGFHSNPYYSLLDFFLIFCFVFIRSYNVSPHFMNFKDARCTRTMRQAKENTKTINKICMYTKGRAHMAYLYRFLCLQTNIHLYADRV